MTEKTPMHPPADDFGPLEAILSDPKVTEIMVNGPHQIFVERQGKLEEVNARFESEDHLLRVISKITLPLGRELTESHPILDVRLEDGSRVNIVGRPIAINGPTMTIRKFLRRPLTAQDLIGFGSWTAEIVQFLNACVLARENIVISGGTGSGKTTVFNIVCSFIPDDERIVTLEYATELILRQKHVVALETRPANLEGKGEVSMVDLVINALKMRPDRIIAGEVHGGEVIHLFQAMNTGHDGSMFTLHANNARDALSRLEIMATMAGLDVPLLTIREQIASAIDVIVHQHRLRDGLRRVTSISEVTGVKNTLLETQDIFVFEETGFHDGRIQGQFVATGYVPTFADRLADTGLALPSNFFDAHVLG